MTTSPFTALAAAESPFANLPESRGGRWGEGLAADVMKPELVGEFEFIEWTQDGH